jgi:G:T-mismatch repair DNA endonuclease (very short patch repair protein)
MKKVDINFIREELAKEDYVLLSDVYVNNRSKLKYKCSRGHIREFIWGNWLKGVRCRLCANEKLSNDRRLDFDVVNISFIAEDYEILECNYVNARSVIKYKCSRGHIFTTNWVNWYSGNRCPICSRDKIKLEYDAVKKAFESEDYVLLEDNYVNSRTKMRYRCPRGNEHSMSWNAWRQGRRCPCCRTNAKLTIDFVRQSFEKENYKLLDDVYINSNTKLKYECPRGHIHSIRWNNWISGNRCPKCNNTGTSRQEQEVIEFIRSLGVNFIEHDKSIIHPYELDIVLPDHKIAIEYCGLYWHSELMDKTRNYHLNKLEGCIKNDYRLITIFEDELVFKKYIIESVLKNKIGIYDGNRIYARKCQVQEINSRQAHKFCDKNHLQSYTGSSVKLGLFYENEIVSVMTFAKRSIAKGSKHKDGYWELSRFCNKIDYLVVGGASKLLKYFEKNYDWKEIISYADRRWSDGNMYYKLGFDFKKFTQPNYWYFKIRDINRIHRFSLRKKEEEPKDKTEWELRQEQDYSRIWDCGNYKFVRRND